MATTQTPACSEHVDSPGCTTGTNQAPLRDLAQLLFARYRAASGDPVPEDQRRIVVVVGAGASNAACGLPIAAELAARIESAVVDVHVPRRLFDAELERLALVNRMAPTDFETRLLAMSKFDARTVLNELRKACDYAHYPSFTYELIAHLLKHGFIDAVVNFNFDELLDQAIEEELGPDQYVRIVGDGDWSRNLRADPDDAYQFDLPLYVKPHGTVGNPESLRFTRDAYFALPPDTAHLLRVLLRGDPVTSFFDDMRSHGLGGGQADSSPSPARPLCLLVLGHALGSFEFNKFMERAPSASRMYVASLAGCPPPESNKEWPECMRAFADGRGISIPDPNGGLDGVMQALWADVRLIADFAEQTKPWLQLRGVLRHQLISTLFAATRPGILLRTSEFQATHDYFLDRLTVELALSIAKTKGFVNLKQLRDGRPGRFFRLLIDHDKRHGRVPPEFTKCIERLGMRRRDSSADCYWHEAVPEDAAGGGKRLTADKATFEGVMRGQLLARCNEFLTRNRREKLVRSPALLPETLSAMFDGDEVEIAPQHGAHASFRFKSPEALRTVAELRRVSRAMIDDPAWSLLLCVAESGEWLTRPPFQDLFERSGRRVCVVVADSVMSGRLNELPHARVESIPWYLHNRHMTIRLRAIDGELVPDRAIHFERRYRSTLISPVLLQDPSDLDQALDDFTVYWLKALRHKSGLSEALQHTHEQLRQERTALLHQWGAA